MPRGWWAQETPKFRGAVPGSVEAAALETISVKLHDQIYPISVADTFDPHLRMLQDKQAEEEGGRGGNRPSQIGRVGGQHVTQSNAVGIKGWPRRRRGRGMRVGLSYRVPPAAMSRGLIARPTCDCVTCFVRKLPRALPEASSGASPSQLHL